LSTESLYPPASFSGNDQGPDKAAICGKKDYLTGLKENVIMGRIIPAGTGFHQYRDDIDVESRLKCYLGGKADSTT
jgi:DNA-directed RNA polymerase subunit beta'